MAIRHLFPLPFAPTMQIREFISTPKLSPRNNQGLIIAYMRHSSSNECCCCMYLQSRAVAEMDISDLKIVSYTYKLCKKSYLCTIDIQPTSMIGGERCTTSGKEKTTKYSLGRLISCTWDSPLSTPPIDMAAASCFLLLAPGSRDLDFN